MKTMEESGRNFRREKLVPHRVGSMASHLPPLRISTRYGMSVMLKPSTLGRIVNLENEFRGGAPLHVLLDLLVECDRRLASVQVAGNAQKNNRDERFHIRMDERRLTDSSSATEAGDEGREPRTGLHASLCSLERVVRPAPTERTVNPN